MNRFITFEGIDGCGKTTQIKLLSNYLNFKNINNKIVREPGGTNVSEKIRSILLDSKNKISSYTETLLFVSARSQLIHEIIKNSIISKQFILCDRYTDSTLSYQGYGRDLNLSALKVLNNFATSSIIPDMTFILDIEVEESIKRKMDNSLDRMELEGKIFMEKVRKGYLNIAKSDKERYFLINCNNKDIKQINNEIISHVDNYYGEILNG